MINYFVSHHWKAALMKHATVALTVFSMTATIAPAFRQTSGAGGRAAPWLGPMSLPGSNQVIPNAIVTWGYWSLQAKACTGDVKSIRCTVVVGNGDAVAHSVCLNSAVLNFAPSDSVGVFLNVPDPVNGLIPQKRAPSLVAPECLTVNPHGERNVVTYLAPDPKKKPLTISVSLEEHIESGSGLSLKARARVPLLAGTK